MLGLCAGPFSVAGWDLGSVFWQADHANIGELGQLTVEQLADRALEAFVRGPRRHRQI